MLMSLSFALAHVDICDFANDTTPQLTFTCSKVATETLEKGVKYVQINSKNTRTTSYIFASNYVKYICGLTHFCPMFLFDPP